MAGRNLTQAQEPFGMNFDTWDLDGGIAGLGGLVQAVQNPQPHALANAIQDLHIEPGESIVSPPS